MEVEREHKRRHSREKALGILQTRDKADRFVLCVLIILLSTISYGVTLSKKVVDHFYQTIFNLVQKCKNREQI